MTIAELMIPELKREGARARKLLSNVPADRMDWNPGESLHTIGWNANHLAELVGWGVDVINTDEFDISPPGGPKYEAPNEKDPKKVLATFDAKLAATLAALDGLSDDAMAKPWTMKAGGHEMFTLSKGDCLRTWVLNHLVHHRAILSVYLRMAGLKLTPVMDE